jgi:hypothetical protein
MDWIIEVASSLCINSVINNFWRCCSWVATFASMAVLPNFDVINFTKSFVFLWTTYCLFGLGHNVLCDFLRPISVGVSRRIS